MKSALRFKSSRAHHGFARVCGGGQWHDRTAEPWCKAVSLFPWSLLAGVEFRFNHWPECGETRPTMPCAGQPDGTGYTATMTVGFPVTMILMVIVLVGCARSYSPTVTWLPPRDGNPAPSSKLSEEQLEKFVRRAIAAVKVGHVEQRMPDGSTMHFGVGVYDGPVHTVRSQSSDGTRIYVEVSNSIGNSERRRYFVFDRQTGAVIKTWLETIIGEPARVSSPQQ